MTPLALFAWIMLIDPLMLEQWHLTEVGVPAAWGRGLDGEGVVVAVLDAGFATAHPDLPEYLPGWNVASASADISPLTPHGTWLVGAIAAIAGNRLGVAGIAPGVRILPVRVTNRRDGGAYAEDIAKGIRYAAARGADIVVAGYAVTDREVVRQAAAELRGAGGLLVLPADTGGDDPDADDSPDILTVAASDRDGRRASWSNPGAQIDIAAPGVDIWTTGTLGKYQQLSGTSLAAPVAAGALALLAGACPGLPIEQLERVLADTAWRHDGGWDPGLGWGVVDVEAALGSLAEVEWCGGHHRPEE